MRKKKDKKMLRELAAKNPPADRRLFPEPSPLAEALGATDQKAHDVGRLIEDFLGKADHEPRPPRAPVPRLSKSPDRARDKKHTCRPGVAVCEHGVFECQACAEERSKDRGEEEGDD